MTSEWEVLISAETLRQRVQELGDAISRDYADREPLLLGILRGAWIFLADLVRCISVPTRCDFMGVSSYGPSTESQGLVRITSDLSEPVTGQDVEPAQDPRGGVLMPPPIETVCAGLLVFVFGLIIVSWMSGN